MTEKQYAPSEKDKKISNKKIKAEAPVQKVEEKAPAEEKKETNKETKVEKRQEPKEKAIAFGRHLPISKKHSMAICKMIKFKDPDRAIEMLNQVLIFKRAVPMNDREVPHRRGDMMAGRFPKNASKEFIGIIKQLKANASVNMIDNPIIVVAKADKAPRPYRRGGVRAKRTHVYLEAKDRTKLKAEKK